MWGTDRFPQCTTNMQVTNASFHIFSNFSYTHLGIFLPELSIPQNSFSRLSTHLHFHQENDSLFPYNTETRAHDFFHRDFELRYYGEWLAVSDFTRKLQEMSVMFSPHVVGILTNEIHRNYLSNLFWWSFSSSSGTFTATCLLRPTDTVLLCAFYISKPASWKTKLHS